MGTTIPRPIHISFFCSWPMSSFLRALSAATWETREDGLRICVRMGATEGRVMVEEESWDGQRGDKTWDGATSVVDGRRGSGPDRAFLCLCKRVERAGGHS